MIAAPSPQSSIPDKTILAQVRADNLKRLMGLVWTVQQAIVVTKTNTGAGK